MMHCNPNLAELPQPERSPDPREKELTRLRLEILDARTRGDYHAVNEYERQYVALTQSKK